MARTLRWGMVSTGVVIALLLGCGRFSGFPDRDGWLIAARGEGIVRLDLRRGSLESLYRVGIGGSTGPVSWLGDGLLVCADSPLQGRHEVVVLDRASGEVMARFEGDLGVAADTARTLVLWRVARGGTAQLMWQDLDGATGPIAETRTESPEFLSSAVRIGATEVVCDVGGQLIVFDAADKTVRRANLRGVVPLCGVGHGWVLGRRGTSDDVALFQLSTGRIGRSFGQLEGRGWTFDPQVGDVLFSTPSRAWLRPEEYDRATLDIQSGAMIRRKRNFLMWGGVVERSAEQMR